MEKRKKWRSTRGEHRGKRVEFSRKLWKLPERRRVRRLQRGWHQKENQKKQSIERKKLE